MLVSCNEYIDIETNVFKLKLNKERNNNIIKYDFYLKNSKFMSFELVDKKNGVYKKNPSLLLFVKDSSKVDSVFSTRDMLIHYIFPVKILTDNVIYHGIQSNFKKIKILQENEQFINRYLIRFEDNLLSSSTDSDYLQTILYYWSEKDGLIGFIQLTKSLDSLKKFSLHYWFESEYLVNLEDEYTKIIDDLRTQ